jgi:hypothetical protein
MKNEGEQRFTADELLALKMRNGEFEVPNYQREDRL